MPKRTPSHVDALSSGSPDPRSLLPEPARRLAGRKLAMLKAMPADLSPVEYLRRSLVVLGVPREEIETLGRETMEELLAVLKR